MRAGEGSCKKETHMYLHVEQPVATLVAPGSDEDLALRLAMASPWDTTRGLFLRTTLDAVSCLGSESAVRDCQRAGGEEKLLDFFLYPVTTHLRMVFSAAHMLAERCGGLDAALRALGYRCADSFLGSAAGMTLQLLANGDVTRLVDRLPMAYRAAANFGTRSLVWMGPRQGRLTMCHEFMPYPFHEGMLLGVLDKAQARGARVQGQQLSTLESEYELSWES